MLTLRIQKKTVQSRNRAPSTKGRGYNTHNQLCQNTETWFIS